jgi:hypothetical protein
MLSGDPALVAPYFEAHARHVVCRRRRADGGRAWLRGDRARDDDHGGEQGPLHDAVRRPRRGADVARGGPLVHGLDRLAHEREPTTDGLDEDTALAAILADETIRQLAFLSTTGAFVPDEPKASP